MRFITQCRHGLCVVLLGLPGNPALAGDPQIPLEDTLTGDWGGPRRTLREAGVDFKFGYVSETGSAVGGDQRSSTLYADQLTFAATFDLDKLLRLPQAFFQVTVTDRNGHNLSSELGTLQQVQEVYGRGQTWLITQFWYQQAFAHGWDWKIGRMTVGEDFATFNCEFMNLTFCGAAPGNIASDWYNWPISQWAVRLKLTLDGFGYLQLGGYVANSNYLLQRYAFTLGNPPGSTGALVPVELGWLPDLGGQKRPGSYKAGIWYDSSQAADVFENGAGQPLVVAGGKTLERNGRYGAYVNVLQQLTGPSSGLPKQGLAAFFNAVITDRRTSTIDNQVNLGTVYTGMFLSRPADDVALALGRTHVNARVSRAEELQNEPGLTPVAVQSAEYVAELYYSLHATRWLILRPNFQYIRQPGGVVGKADDIVLGLKVVLSL